MDAGTRMCKDRATTRAALPAVLFVLCSQVSPAQEISTNLNTATAPAENAVVNMQEIVVTATRLERPRASVPASVTIWEQPAVRSSPAWNSDELLRTASGISVIRGYGLGYGITSQINIRGVPGVHGVLLLADGTPLNEAATGFLAVCRTLPLRGKSPKTANRLGNVGEGARRRRGGCAMLPT